MLLRCVVVLELPTLLAAQGGADKTLSLQSDVHTTPVM